MNSDNEVPTDTDQISFWHRYQKGLWTVLVAGALTTAAVLVYIIFFRGQGPVTPYQGDVQLTVSAVKELPSGSDVSYEINIKNLSNSKLQNLVLEVFYPRGFTFIDSTPDAPGLAAREYTFADLLSGGGDKLVIVGNLEGTVQEIKTFSVKLHYVPENFRSSFVAEAQAVTAILAPNIDFSIKAPPHLITGQTITYEMTLENIATKPFSNLTVRLTYPEKFEKTGQEEWRIANLAIGERQTIKLSGRLLESSDRESLVSAELYLVDEAGEEVLSGRSFAFTQMRPPPLRITQTVSQAKGSVLAGEGPAYQVAYENVSDTGLKSVRLRIVFVSPDPRYLEVKSQRGQWQNNSLVFTAQLIPELLILSPGQRGQIEFPVTLLEKISSSGQKNPVIKSVVEFSSDEIPEAIASEALELKVATKLSLEARARVVSGANPPIAGSPTTYQVDLLVMNTVNDVENAILTASIPGLDSKLNEESIAPQTERANVAFSPTSGRFEWRVGEISAFTGSVQATRILSFELSTSDLGLLQAIQITGKDKFTGEEVVSNKLESLFYR